MGQRRCQRARERPHRAARPSRTPSAGPPPPARGMGCTVAATLWDEKNFSECPSQRPAVFCPSRVRRVATAVCGEAAVAQELHAIKQLCTTFVGQGRVVRRDWTDRNWRQSAERLAAAQAVACIPPPPQVGSAAFEHTGQLAPVGLHHRHILLVGVVERIVVWRYAIVPCVPRACSTRQSSSRLDSRGFLSSSRGPSPDWKTSQHLALGYRRWPPARAGSPGSCSLPRALTFLRFPTLRRANR